jgi:hypothetical protein
LRRSRISAAKEAREQAIRGKRLSASLEQILAYITYLEQILAYIHI